MFCSISYWDNVWGNNVRFASLIDNAPSNFGDCDYTAMEINKMEEDVWIVFHGKVKEIITKHDKDETYFSIGTYTFTNDDLTLESYGTYLTDFGNNTITLHLPYNSRDLLKEFNEAKFTIEVLKEIIPRNGCRRRKTFIKKVFR